MESWAKSLTGRLGQSRVPEVAPPESKLVREWSLLLLEGAALGVIERGEGDNLSWWVAGEEISVLDAMAHSLARQGRELGPVVWARLVHRGGQRAKAAWLRLEPQWAPYSPAEESYWLLEVNELRESRLSKLGEGALADFRDRLAAIADRCARVVYAQSVRNAWMAEQSCEQVWSPLFPHDELFDPALCAELAQAVEVEYEAFHEEAGRRSTATAMLGAALPAFATAQLRARELDLVWAARRAVIDARSEQRWAA